VEEVECLGIIFKVDERQNKDTDAITRTNEAFLVWKAVF